LAGAGAYGRVYAICVGDSVDEVRTISADAESALRGMVEQP
jgi:hypothetical protein